MSKITLITGGARSGKSSFGEKLAMLKKERVAYIATAIPFDDEMKSRIQYHRLQRPQSWHTFEAYRDLDSAIRDYDDDHFDIILLDCVTIMITNLMLEKDCDWDHLGQDEILELETMIRIEFNKLIVYIKKTSLHLIIVTNELGMGLVPEYPLGRIFRDIAGRINQMLAETSDEVYFIVSGIPLQIK